MQFRENNVRVLENITKPIEGKAIPAQAWTAIEVPGFQGSRHMKVVRLSALRMGRLYPHEIFLVLISVRG